MSFNLNEKKDPQRNADDQKQIHCIHENLRIQPRVLKRIRKPLVINVPKLRRYTSMFYLYTVGLSVSLNSFSEWRREPYSNRANSLSAIPSSLAHWRTLCSGLSGRGIDLSNSAGPSEPFICHSYLRFSCKNYWFIFLKISKKHFGNNGCRI